MHSVVYSSLTSSTKILSSHLEKLQVEQMQQTLGTENNGVCVEKRCLTVINDKPGAKTRLAVMPKDVQNFIAPRWKSLPKVVYDGLSCKVGTALIRLLTSVDPIGLH